MYSNKSNTHDWYIFNKVRIYCASTLLFFFTYIHDYDEDYSRDLLELLPHNLKQKGIL